MKNIKLMPILMAVTIIAIAGFQVYWISKSYEREERTLDMRTNMMFRETMRNLQTAKLKLDKIEKVSVGPDSGTRLKDSRVFIKTELKGSPRIQLLPRDKMASMMDVVMQKAGDSSRPRVTMENGEMKREMINDTVKVIAWYTTDVPVPAGPNFAGQLPGLILELDVNDGQSVTKAIEFSPKVSASKIKEPSDGKKITAAEFTKERDKMMEEMRKNSGGRDVIRMQ